MEFTITGIQYYMQGANANERKEKASNFVRDIKPGTILYLKAESDNQWDEKAIAVYLNYQKIGYIATEQTRWLHPLLEKSPLITAFISHGDHITLFCEVPIAEETTPQRVSTRKIEICPLDRSVYLPFKEEEHQQELLAELILNRKWSEEEQVDLFLELVENYVPLAKLSLCDEDSQLPRLIQKRLEMFHQALGPLSPEREKRFKDTQWQLRDILGDRHRDGGSHGILSEHLERLHKEACKRGELFEKYDQFYLDTSLEQAPQERVVESLAILKRWLNDLPQGAYRLYNKQEKNFAQKLNYLKLSRVELYEVLAVYLLVKRLEAYLKAHPVSTPQTASAAPEQQAQQQPSRRGPSKKFLFTSKDSNKEDEATRGREKERLCRYLSDHKLGSRNLTCDKKDTLNKVVTCFLREWRERGLIAEKPSGGAIFRFLTEVCGLTSEVTLASYSNKVVQWLEQPVDSFTKLDVKECFKK